MTSWTLRRWTLPAGTSRPRASPDAVGVAANYHQSVPEDLSAATIDRAAELLRPVVRRTPLEHSDRLTDAAGHPVLLKREDIQVCRSYKVRGAYNVIASLDAGQRGRGVVCASAGNHGQGLAFACSQLACTAGCTSHQHSPPEAPAHRGDRRPVGGADLFGRHLRRGRAAALEDCQRTGAVYVHAFDDPRTIAGQGTVGIEIAGQSEDGLEHGGRPRRRRWPDRRASPCGSARHSPAPGSSGRSRRAPPVWGRP